MTLDEIATEIKDRLNVTSSTATTRIKRIVNRYHRRVCAAINIAGYTKRQLGISADTTIGDQEVEFVAMERISRVWYVSGSDKVFLDDVTLDELRDENRTPSGNTPSRWAPVSRIDVNCIIMIDMEPTSIYELFADGYGNALDMGDDDVPQFPEAFHDILVEGPLQDEYKKLKQKDLARDSKLEYERILSDLKHWNSVSIYRQIQQNRRPRGNRFRRDNLV